ncbi:hypothetical protein C8F01DRAFT_1369202 [Mycena amicta]|nr:hypothetical protein C8F01DRAFT_1369202 [Mycena amicta]
MENLDFLHVDEEPVDGPDSEDEGDTSVHAKPANANMRERIHSANTSRLRARLGLDADGSLLEKVTAVLDCMSAHNLNLPIFLEALLWGDDGCRADSRCRYARASLMTDECFPSILERCHRPPRPTGGTIPAGGRIPLEKFALDCVEELIDKEMEATAPLFRSPRKEMTAKNLIEIDFGEIKAQLQAEAPTLWALLHTAAYTPAQVKKNKKKNPDMIIMHMISQAQYTRSNRRARFTKLWSLYLRACGVPVRAFDALHAIGLVMSHKWTVEAVKALSDEGLELVRNFIHLFPWAISHDNDNIAMRVFSMHLNNSTSFISGCAFTVYILPSRAALPETANCAL